MSVNQHDFSGLNGFTVQGLTRKNILLGKNGCGKSHVLKILDRQLRAQPQIGALRYISPERGGSLQYEPSIEHNITSSPQWLTDSRRQNQAGQFRQQSTAQFRRLELLILRQIEQDPALRSNPSVTFDTTLQRINSLLDRVYLKRADPAFQIHDKRTHAQVGPEQISSGESELISLGIECLVFRQECVDDRYNLLLLDEPDVHLHPDLQARFARFVEGLVSSSALSVLIATHSTALLGAMSDDADTHLSFMRYGDTELKFLPITDAQRRILPVFGAHPLSNVFNQAPVLLLEGEDDERIWQQAVRSSNGLIKIYPCSVEGISELSTFEREVSGILSAVYDGAVGYSLRDRDLAETEIDDLGPILRMRLNCRAAENLLLTDEVLESLHLTWADVTNRVTDWLGSNLSHPHFEDMKTFAESAFDRRNSNLKAIRNDLVGLMGSHKPWEVLVGKCIAAIVNQPRSPSTTSLSAFLGDLVCGRLLGID